MFYDTPFPFPCTSLVYHNSLDTSEWVRSADYPPTRMEAQLDAVKVIIQAKRQRNQENSIGIMTMAGDQGYMNDV